VSPSQDAAAAPAASEAPAAGAAAAGETAAAVKLASWQEITAQVTAAGRPAVLDIWALSCEPCLKEFPGLVRLHKELGDQVACYAANIEFDGRKTRPPETYRQPVEAFLTSVGATLPSFISTTSSDDIYTDADIDSIPAVIVYDADGSIVKKFVDAGDTAGFTYDKDVIPLVRQLLADN
jgi:thiol-disulfide isomerase/thioredoxin